MNTYIIGSAQHCDVIIEASNSKEAKDKYAQLIGYDDYRDLKSKVGHPASYIDLECLYETKEKEVLH